MGYRQALKVAAYHSGAFAALHRLRNKHSLTTVMFHRILPPNSPEWAGANSTYGLSTEIFDACLAFFLEHYSPVSLEQVLASRRHGEPLPNYPLLVTFDDGWVDTLTEAAPRLAAAKIPGVCFVIGDAINETAPSRWQDAFSLAWRQGKVDEGMVREAWRRFDLQPLPNAKNLPSDSYIRSYAMMSDLRPDACMKLVEGWLGDIKFIAPRQLLSAEGCAALAEQNVAIGAHGATHVPLTLSRDPKSELVRSRNDLERALAKRRQSVTAMSFPHGRCNSVVMQHARSSGYELMFTSEQVLATLSNGGLKSDVCGRIAIGTDDIVDSRRRFRPELLARSLFSRDAH